MATGALSNGSGGSNIAALVANSAQTSTPTPIILKVGNIKLQGDATYTSGSGSVTNPALILMVFYLPEGIAMNDSTAGNVAAQHPEWIMAWKMIDVQVGSGVVPASSFSVSSRLKRNLNSGDRICIGYMHSDPLQTVRINFAAQYWTCAN